MKIYTNECPIELMKRVNYFGFPGLMDREFLIVGKGERPEDRDLIFLINKVLSFYELDLERLQFPSRKKLKVRAKHVCYYLLSRYFSIQKVDLAEKFNIDHTTVIHGIKMVNDQLRIHNSIYETEVKQILQILNKNALRT